MIIAVLSILEKDTLGGGGFPIYNRNLYLFIAVSLLNKHTCLILTNQSSEEGTMTVFCLVAINCAAAVNVFASKLAYLKVSWNETHIK